MDHALPPPLAPSARPRYPAILIGLMLALALPEIVLTAADRGLWGSGFWRPLSYQYGGFWTGLLGDWRPNYRGQPALMFLTHIFLHAGPGHLIGNLLALHILGLGAVHRLGAARFLTLGAATGLGGALAFGALSDVPAPMVGASGVVFGLAGAWTLWDRSERLARGQADRSLWLMLAVVAINLAGWLAMSGQLAWQTHLGGYLAGLLFVAVGQGRPMRV